MLEEMRDGKWYLPVPQGRSSVLRKDQPSGAGGVGRGDVAAFRKQTIITETKPEVIPTHHHSPGTMDSLVPLESR